MTLSVVVPVYDDAQEAADTVEAVRASLIDHIDVEYVFADVRACNGSLPAAKNHAISLAAADLVFFLAPGFSPGIGAVERLAAHFQNRAELGAVCGRWSNAKGKVEIGYNVRRFPSFIALVFDILLINKLVPRNRFTRRYKMHDFDHLESILVEHANDCVFMVRRSAIERHRGFDDRYAPGWFDQLEFCERLSRAGERILFDPAADFVCNDRVPLIDRLVQSRYLDYRRAENRYIRRRFGDRAASAARVCLAIGMLERILFSILIPARLRNALLRNLRSYVDDEYIRGLRGVYRETLREALLGTL